MRMTCKPLLASVLFLTATMSIGRAGAEEPALKTVHLFNVASAAAEADLLGALDEMNQVIAKAGYPQSRYRVWKVQGDPQGSHTYLWESTWPDPAAYAKVHEDQAYQGAFERVRSTIDASMKDHVYNRYLEVPVAKGKK